MTKGDARDGPGLPSSRVRALLQVWSFPQEQNVGAGEPFASLEGKPRPYPLLRSDSGNPAVRLVVGGQQREFAHHFAFGAITGAS